MNGARGEPPLLDLADRGLESVRGRLGPGVDAELFLCRGRARGIELREGSIETIHETRDAGVGVRVAGGGRMGFAYSAGVGLDGLQAVFEEVMAQLRHLPPDGHRALPEPRAAAAAGEPAGDMSDPALFARPIQEQIPRLSELGADALRRDRRVRQVLRQGYGEYFGEVAIVSTRGVRGAEAGTHCSVGIAVVAEADGVVQVGSGSSSARFYSDLDFGRAGSEAAFRAGSTVEARRRPPGRKAAIWDPWVSGELLDLVSDAMSAELIQRGKSLFAGRLGERVASPAVTILDDPRLPRGLASTSFDDEGVPTERKAMVEAGVLRDYFYDTYTASRDGRASNGSAGRGSYKGAPGPSSSNFFLKPGPMTRDALIAGTRDGVLVLEVLGMHMADPVTGEFSVGVSGIAVEGGMLADGVRGAMLSGNVLELLERVDAVADDLTFYGRIASPTFRVADMTFA